MIGYNDFVKMYESNNSVIGLSKVEEIIKKVFLDTKVSSVNTIYEDIKDGGLKMIITINNIYYEKTNVIHTKLVFYTDKKKTKPYSNTF